VDDWPSFRGVRTRSPRPRSHKGEPPFVSRLPFVRHFFVARDLPAGRAVATLGTAVSCCLQANGIIQRSAHGSIHNPQTIQSVPTLWVVVSWEKTPTDSCANVRAGVKNGTRPGGTCRHARFRRQEAAMGSLLPRVPVFVAISGG